MLRGGGESSQTQNFPGDAVLPRFAATLYIVSFGDKDALVRGALSAHPNCLA